jgi:hypothetical protein
VYHIFRMCFVFAIYYISVPHSLSAKIVFTILSLENSVVYV